MTTLKASRAWGPIGGGTTRTESRSAVGLHQGVAATTISHANHHPPRRSATAGHSNNSNEPAGHDLAAHGDLERHCGVPWFS
jgi:hypothetical protein